jgi:hypothetical protein
MKRQRQRSAEIAKKRADAKARKEAKKYADGLKNRVIVNMSALHPTNSYGTPPFVQRGYYLDLPFRCRDCGKQQIWTAKQQQWWYESAKGDVWTVAVRCRECRRRDRQRKDEARQIHFKGIGRV